MTDDVNLETTGTRRSNLGHWQISEVGPRMNLFHTVKETFGVCLAKSKKTARDHRTRNSNDKSFF